MVDINYIKRKNIELFKSLEDSNLVNITKPQNYIPIYNCFFSLNETNYNTINLNQKWYLSNLVSKESENKFIAKLKNNNTQKVKESSVFFKMAPLLDPFKYLVGKYPIEHNLFNLPSHENMDVMDKLKTFNNSAYVDGLFAYLNNYLLYEFNFLNGLKFYGSYLGIKNNFKLNVYDDLDYLQNSDFFKKHRDNLYIIDNYDHLFETEQKLKPIKLQESIKSTISYESIEKLEYDNLFIDTKENKNQLEEMDELITDVDEGVSLKSSSSCSSRTSHTCSDDSECLTEDSSTESDSVSSSSSEGESIFATIKNFPVQLIALENCVKTLDDLIVEEKLTEGEWGSILIQVIMILITFQKAFHFTHNDLHTNNIMYVSTDKKYLYYQFKNIQYKVPTYGKIFKIIDYGRAIFKCNGKLFCSDSFKPGEDAATQYNTEPYFNSKKPRLEPNFSFDLCRLGCSIFDYLVDDLDELNDMSKFSSIERLIIEWCFDDSGINLLYKTNGVDRYPDFKLYKMIARCVHKHTPQSQLDKSIFKTFILKSSEKVSDLINIDNIPSFIH
jgi:hypothetical protein